MATLDAAATLEQAADFATDYATATITVQQGATVLATHTATGFTASNSGNNGVATANAIAQETIVATGTADTVLISAAGKTIDITADVTLATTNYVLGEPSNVSSLVFTFPAS